MADQKTPSLLERVQAMAEELKLEGEEKEKYVDQHMVKAGWKRSYSYEPPEGGSGGGGSGKTGWFAE
jgi:hypothetical protein